MTWWKGHWFGAIVFLPSEECNWTVELKNKSIRTFFLWSPILCTYSTLSLCLTFSSHWAVRVWTTASKFTWLNLVISHLQPLLNLAVLTTCKETSIQLSLSQLSKLGQISYEQKEEITYDKFLGVFARLSTVDKEERKTSPKRESFWIDKRKTTTEAKVRIKKNRIWTISYGIVWSLLGSIPVSLSRQPIPSSH